MNCQRFEYLITDLARECVLEESIRSQALAHAESCPGCSARLVHERALSAALKLMAADPGEAPAHIEAALISAYRARTEASLPAASSRPGRRVLSIGYWGIAAALVVALLGVTTFRLLRINQPDETRSPRSALPIISPAPPRQTARDVAPERIEPKAVPAPKAANANLSVKQAAPRSTIPKEPPAPVEIASDFIQLASNAELSSMESGQLIRVQLPRNVMASYGIPVNQERADEPVTAQVLIGQDGWARAIRFLNKTHASIVQAGNEPKR